MPRLSRTSAIGVLVGAALLGAPPAAAFAQQASAHLTASGAVLPDPYSTRALTLAPFRAGDRYFNTDQTGALYVRNDLRAPARVILPAGSFTVVAPSHDGRYLAYALAPAGAMAYEVHVRDVETGRDLGDVLHSARISAAPWTHNAKGFFYVRSDTTGHRERVYYHSLGRGEAADAVMLSQFDHPEWRYAARVSDDGQFAVFTISHPADAKTRLYFIDMTDGDKPRLDAPVVRLVDEFDSRYEFVDNAGSYFFLQTDRGAPRGRVVLANTDITRETRWPAVLPESSDTLLYARTAGDEFVIPVYHTAGGTVARIYGPPNPKVVRAEMQRRLDSLRKARANEPRGQRPIGGVMPLRDLSPIRLELRGEIPIPAQSSIVAINTVADDEHVLYTVRMPDGTLSAFVYDVKNERNEPYPTGQGNQTAQSR